MKTFNTSSLAFVLIATLCITAYGNSANTSTPQVIIKSLNQAAYKAGTIYEFAFNSIPNIPIMNAPTDTDFSRYAMLHDGGTYRLYFFKQNSSDTIYQFGYNLNTQKYEFGFNSISVLKLKNTPRDADTKSFAMLYDGTTYRLYLKSKSNDTKMYQFGFNSRSNDYEYGFNSIPILSITSAPTDTNFDRWSMLHDGSAYRLYIGKTGEKDTLYQFSFNTATSNYEWRFNSIPELQITNMPSDSIKSNFTMLHDQFDYRFYYPSSK